MVRSQHGYGYRVNPVTQPAVQRAVAAVHILHLLLSEHCHVRHIPLHLDRALQFVP